VKIALLPMKSKPLYHIIKKHTDDANNIELRLAKIDNGYSVGVWDLDVEEYYPEIHIFPHTLENALEMAIRFFERYANKILKAY